MRKTLVIIALLLCPLLLCAQETASVAMPFSIVPRNVRTLSLGGLTTANSTAFRLFGDEQLDFNFSWYKFAPETAGSDDLNLGAFVRVSSRVAIAAEMGLDIARKYYIYDANGAKSGSYVPRDMIVKIGAAYRIGPRLSAGLDLRYMHSSLTPAFSLSAFAADLMLGADLGAVKIAGGLSSVGTPVRAMGGSLFSLPAALTLAGNYRCSFAGGHSVDAGLQADYFFVGGFRVGAGVEYGYKDRIFARAGYSLGLNSPFPTYLSFGIGAKYKGICFNAAYLLGTEAIGNTVAVGAGLEF